MVRSALSRSGSPGRIFTAGELHLGTRWSILITAVCARNAGRLLDSVFLKEDKEKN